MTIEFLGKRIIVDKNINQNWIIEDDNSNLTYHVSNTGEDIKVTYGLNESRLFSEKFVSGPSGVPCPTCNGSGRLK